MLKHWAMPGRMDAREISRNLTQPRNNLKFMRAVDVESWKVLVFRLELCRRRGILARQLCFSYNIRGSVTCYPVYQLANAPAANCMGRGPHLDCHRRQVRRLAGPPLVCPLQQRNSKAMTQGQLSSRKMPPTLHISLTGNFLRDIRC